MTTEEEEELEDLTDEANAKETATYLANLNQRYKDLLGTVPDHNLSPEEIRSQIRGEMISRGIRPYKL